MLQPVGCALGGLAQQCLEGMEYQFNWIEVRRIPRQVSQFCAAGLDCLLHASDLVEGDVVNDDDAPPPRDIVRYKRGTLLRFTTPLISIGATIPV